MTDATRQGICVDNLSFIIPRRGAALVPWQRVIDLVLLTVIMSLSYLVGLSYHYSVASDR
jgi:hypothetical protein